MDENLYNFSLNPGGWGNFGNYGALVNPTAFSSIGAELPAPGVSLAPTLPVGGAPGGASPFFSMDSFFGKNGQQGWGNLALGAASGLGGLLMGMKQYGLARDALSQSQSQFDKNYAAQRQTINTQLEDRQRARVAATNGGAESVESYLERNRIR